MSGAASPSEDPRRRLRAKRQNERMKLGASSLNTLAMGLLGAAVIVPGVTSLQAIQWQWIPVGLILHGGAHLLLGRLTSED